jgi:HSP20 family molecular chaperone IbpA
MTYAITRPVRVSSHFPSIYSDGIWDEFDKLLSSATKAFPVSTSIPYDIKRYDDKTVLELAVAGFGKEDIKIEVENGYITIKGEIGDLIDEKHQVLRKGISKRNFEYSFALSEWVDEANIKADAKDGILQISIPDKPEVIEKKKKKEIPIL